MSVAEAIVRPREASFQRNRWGLTSMPSCQWDLIQDGDGKHKNCCLW